MINSYLINLRNFYKNQTRKVILVEKNNKILNNWYIWPIQPLVFFNLTYIIDFFGYNYIYNIDNIIFYYKSRSLNLLRFHSGTISKFFFNKIDITDDIKKYHIDIPLYIIFYLENLDEEHVNIDIEIINFGKISRKVYYNFNDIKYKKLSDLI